MKRGYIFFSGSVLFLYLLIGYPLHAYAQKAATAKEFLVDYTTYPFSEPDPVPDNGKIYPYFRYDGFTDKPVQKSWKVVELENDYIRVRVMPQIGGKIWTAIDKKNGKPFLYDNGVVKFRDIAMRGAWTSGGIEVNFGIIGHTPAVATPVDYLFRTNVDGSASCFISNLDLLTRSRWILEIRLPKDKAYFITKVHWQNNSPVTEPYYSWMNLAVKASDSLHFIDPGTHYIGHDGSAHSWPIDSLNRKNLSVYGQNNFGGAKSYHIVGVHSNYFGAYWPEENFGMIHYAEREDKLGRKIFLWALSDEGKIWERLLTDKSGQYVELQSGRLFNQNMFKSSYTPFKQRGFLPYQSDRWSEYWYPFSNINRTDLADLNGVYEIRLRNDTLIFNISPVSKVSDTLFLYDREGRKIYRKMVDLAPLEPFSSAILLKNDELPEALRLGNSYFRLDDSKVLSRPVNAAQNFDWNSGYGLYILGRDAANQRTYKLAEDYIRRSLQKDSVFIPALTEMSSLQFRKMNYDSSFYFAGRALSIDTYDPGANYYYGLAAERSARYYDALDGFEVASLSPLFRSAAYTEMSKMYLKRKDFEKALEYSVKSLENNTDNTVSLQVTLLAARLLNKSGEVDEIQKRLLEIDPINHMVAFERFWNKKDEKSRADFSSSIRNELPAETYLELAIWYYNLNRLEESKAILSMAPQNNEIQYWEAFLNKGTLAEKQILGVADRGDAGMVFPFRDESAKVMEWAMHNTSDWKPRYYMALIQLFRNNKEKAGDLLQSISDKVDFAPLYITKARLSEENGGPDQLADLERSVSLKPDEWRYRKYLAEFYLKNNESEKALQTIQAFYLSHPDNYIIGMVYIRALMSVNRFKDAEKLLANITILPFEGATNGHNLYRETKLMLALEAMKSRRFKLALNKVKEAREWPMNLGEGKPFSASVHSQLEDSLERAIKEAEKDKHASIDYEKFAGEIANINRR